MAIHPPTLFIGYAGLTIPFAYAISALIVNDDSTEWVNRSTPYLMFSWLLLGVGIGLGAVWAYVVLGWGGYWGWDPVENASLLPWLVGVALIHSFTVYRQRGAFKRWSVFCACLTFCFVVLGTFITRSGLVQSVHAFEGDPVSLVMFGALIICSLLAGIVGGDSAILFWGGVVVCGGVVPAACGVAGMKKTEGALSLAIVAVVGAFIGAVAYRVLMWTASIALMSLFGVSI